MSNRVCRTPGCPDLTNDRSGLCPNCLAAQRAHVDARRPTAHRRGYDQAHRDATAQARATGQRCQHPNGCHRTDVHRDHIDGDPRNNQPTNIQWLCATHHGAKTATHDVQRDANGRILPKHRDTPRRPARARPVDL